MPQPDKLSLTLFAPPYLWCCRLFDPPTNLRLRNTEAWFNKVDGWRSWALLTPGLTEEELKMAAGPPLYATLFARADISGVRFTTKGVEGKRKAKDSVVMIRHLSQLCGGAEFGRVQMFLEVQKPGLTEATAKIANVEWLKILPGNHMNAELGCPVVSRQIRSDPEGNFWDVTQIIPTKVILAPHLKQPAMCWQVLTWTRTSSPGSMAACRNVSSTMFDIKVHISFFTCTYFCNIINSSPQVILKQNPSSRLQG